MPRRTPDEPLRARVHADVERADRIVFGLTLRKVVILAVTALILYAVWTALATVVNSLYCIAGSIPIGGAAFFSRSAAETGPASAVGSWPRSGTGRRRRADVNQPFAIRLDIGVLAAHRASS